MLRFVYLFFCLSIASPLFAQHTDLELERLIRHQDSLFWLAYNQCDTASFEQFFTADIEFYHDKGGITLGSAAMVASMRNNLCGNPGFQLRRAAIDSSIVVYPLAHHDSIYGAIISGAHLFFVTESGKKEQLTGKARFTHLWLKQPDGWRMARILSFDHQANPRQVIVVNAAELTANAGIYQSKQTGQLRFKPGTQCLILDLENTQMVLWPASQHLYFLQERDLTFEFTQLPNSEKRMVIIRENGHIVDEAIQR